MIKEEVEKFVRDALEGGDFDVNEISLEHPEDTAHGDFSTSVAFHAAKKMQKSPQAIAQEIVSLLEKQNSPLIERIEAKQGFVNFYLKEQVLIEAVGEVNKQKEKFGQNKSLEKKKGFAQFKLFLSLLIGIHL